MPRTTKSQNVSTSSEGTAQAQAPARKHRAETKASTGTAARRPRPKAETKPPLEPAATQGNLRESIAQLAYRYWEAQGRVHGNHGEDWFRAEREVLGQFQA